jgi:hypothetical protein
MWSLKYDKTRDGAQRVDIALVRASLFLFGIEYSASGAKKGERARPPVRDRMWLSLYCGNHHRDRPPAAG